MSTTELLRSLVDDAAVFPPGNVPLPDAVAAHRAHRSSSYAPFIGPLLVRANDAAPLASVLEPGERLKVAFIVRAGSDVGVLPTAVEQAQRDERCLVVGLEAPVSDPMTLRPVTDLGLPVWLEVRAEHLDEDLDAVDAIGAHAKFRTGGLSHDDFPSQDDLAAFIVGAVRRGLRFKLTAGLHHAVRNTDPEQGFEQHGVANVLAGTAVATATALDRDTPADVLSETIEAVAALLDVRDGKALARDLRALDAGQIASLRASFASFGCCGVTDPLSELADLDLLPKGTL